MTDENPSDDQVVISWDASNINPDDLNSGYVVEVVRKDGQPLGGLAAPELIHDTFTTVSGLEPGVEYVVTVTAVSPVGSAPDPGNLEEAPSDPLDFTKAESPLVAPGNVVVTDVANTTATVSWDASEGAVDYAVSVVEKPVQEMRARKGGGRG